MKNSTSLENLLPVIAFTSLAGIEYYFNNPYYTGIAIAAAIISCYLSKYLYSKKIKRALALPQKSQLLTELPNLLAEKEKSMDEAAGLIAELGNKGERIFTNLDEHSALGIALKSADTQLKDYNIAEDKRKWRIEGIAKFSDMLRTHNVSIEQLSRELINGIVKYIGANQGGLFLYKKEGDDEFLERTACYAFDRKRLSKKRVSIWDGLIGQCFVEKDTLYITDIPVNYVEITSGMGHANPTNLVLIPLVNNEKIHGVLEFATFTPLEQHQVRFLEQLADNIASVFVSLMTAEHTQALLDDSQKLTADLQSSEEEMRQNMEELSATQEEMERKQFELDGLMSAINNTLGLAELDTKGNIIFANNILLSTLGYDDEEIKSVSYKKLVGLTDGKCDFLHRINTEEIPARDYRTKNKNDDLLWLNISFSPIVDGQGNSKKILLLATDITERKLEEIEFEKLSLVADNTDNSVIITDKHGIIEYVNQGFCEMTGYTKPEVMGKRPGDFLQGKETNKETIERIGQRLRENQPVYDEILNYTKNGESYWISMAINPVFNDNGGIDNFISIQANITETKKRALDFSYKLKAISKSNAIIEFDKAGHILEANDNFLKIMGYDESDEIIGKHHSIFVAQEERESEAYIKFWEDLGTGQFISDEFKRINKKGETVWLKGIYNPIYDINGNPYKIVKFAIDITREKHLKLETQKQEAELSSQLMAINNTIASVELDMQGNLKQANDIFLSITGISADSIKKMNYFDIIPETEKDKPQTVLLWDNLREGKFFSGEFKFKDTTGKELWLKGTFNPINDWEGKPYKVMVYAQFNTSEKEKQKNLTGTVNALKNTTPIMELNADGTFKTANELFFQAFGYKRLALRQKPFEVFLANDKNTPQTKDILKKLEASQVVEYDLNYKDAHGELKTFRTTFSPITDLEENLVKVVVILIDRKVVLKV